MARRIRWQLIIAAVSILIVAGMLGRLALRTSSVANPLAGGTYVEAVVGAPIQPIPLLNDPLADPNGRALGALLFDGLVRIGVDGLIEPGLATYTVDPSGEIYTFTLRRNAVWHDGAPVTADDVVFTLRSLQILDQPGDPGMAMIWQDILVDRIDDHTVRATLTRPFAPFLSLARVPILPAHLLNGIAPQDWSESAYAGRLVGTGPYRLVELREDRAVLEANPQYFDGPPYINQVELRFFSASEAAVAALTRGDVTAFGDQSNTTLGGLDLPPTLRAVSTPLDAYATLSFNLNRAPFDELPVRRALAHALNKDALIEGALDGLGNRLDTPILPGWWAADPTVQWYAADPERATHMFNELGFDEGIGGVRQREGRPLALELLVDGEPRRIAAANAIAAQWNAVGVGVQVQQLSAAELRARLEQRDFDVALHSWVRLGPDPDPFALWHSSQADEGLNYAGLRDEQIDELLDAARAQSDLAERAADYAAFQQRWVDLIPGITLYQPVFIFAFDAELGGIAEDPAQGGPAVLFGAEDRYRTITRWFTDSYREIQGDLR
jgi:peptide/nickel transport system substrate-binding protein